MVEISASVLQVKKEDSIKTFYNLETSKIDYFHIDAMDGKFVKENTADLMRQYSEYIKTISNVPLDVHLMVEDVENHIINYSILEPNIITFHIEAVKNKEEAMKMINLIKQNNIKAGISIKPNTSIEEIKDYLPYINQILVMTVEPGYGGQKLIPETLEKIKELKKYLKEQNLETYIEADGGINLETVEEVKKAGVDIIVCGSAIVNSEDYKKTVEELKR